MGDSASLSQASAESEWTLGRSGQVKNSFKIAVVQMDSGAHKADNLRFATAAIDEAASAHAQVVCFPELMNEIVVPANPDEFEPIPGKTTQLLSQKAREAGVFVHGGSISERIEGDVRSYNTSFVISPEGELISVYRKIHMFDIALSDGTTSKESARVKPGSELSVVNTQLGTWGTAICYDLRFPELFRLMALAGAQIIFVPANFTYSTGNDHWETLVRARAIENGCYVVATDQCGEKPEFRAFGTSMVVDPWGTVLARASSDEPEIIYADISLDRVCEVQEQLPFWSNRRTDVYDLRLL